MVIISFGILLLVQVPNRHEKWSKDDQKMKQNRPN